MVLWKIPLKFEHLIIVYLSEWTRLKSVVAAFSRRSLYDHLFFCWVKLAGRDVCIILVYWCLYSIALSCTTHGVVSYKGNQLLKLLSPGFVLFYFRWRFTNLTDQHQVFLLKTDIATYWWVWTKTAVLSAFWMIGCKMD